jgi:hypothetical protein
MSDIKILSYSDKSFCVIGNTIEYKDLLKSFGGKYNRYLTLDDKKVQGWIFSNKNKELVEQWLRNIEKSDDKLEEIEVKTKKVFSDDEYIDMLEKRVKTLTKVNRVLTDKINSFESVVGRVIEKDKEILNYDKKVFNTICMIFFICLLYYIYYYYNTDKTQLLLLTGITN